MTTFLSGGTGTPKLVTGVSDTSACVVIGNTGDDIELGGHLICPDLDTVVFLLGGLLDRETWWGIADDTVATHERIQEVSAAMGFDSSPRRLSDAAQVGGRDIARWRRFSGVGEFMEIGDYDRAVHIIRTSLLDEGYSLSEVTAQLAAAFSVSMSVYPMSDDPVATIIHTPDGEMHFQEYWVAHRASPRVEDVEYRGADEAEITGSVREALADEVIIGPSNPITSIGPMVAIDSFRAALEDTSVVAVSPFVGDTVFSGPAGELLEGMGFEPSTKGVAAAYPYVDAFVLDTADDTSLDRPVVRTNTSLDSPEDAARVLTACHEALAVV